MAKLFEAMEHTIQFRRNVSLSDNTRFIQRKWLKEAKNQELICKFYANLELKPLELRGNLKFSLVPKDNDKIQVVLRSVNNLVPRTGRESLDLSVTVSTLPWNSDANYRLNHRTKVYANTTFHVFDLTDDHLEHKVQDETYQSLLDVGDGKGGEKFLQFVFYDHSRFSR